MYWKQFLIAVAVAALTGYATYASGVGTLAALAVGVVVYMFARGFMTWMIRVRYWYPRDSSNSRTCPDCGQYIYRIGGDWVLKCHGCGWKAGWLGVRVVTHSVAATQLKRTIWDPKLGLGITSARSGISGRVQGTIHAVFSREFLILSVLLVGVGIAGGMYLGVVDDEQVPGVDSDMLSQDNIDEREVEKLVAEKLNEERTTHGHPELRHHDRAQEAARSHAEDMADREYFSHTSPDGVTQQERYSFCNGGENIHQTWVNERVEIDDRTERFTSEEELADGIVQGWMDSDPHRERGILGEYWEAGSAGVAITDKGKVYAVFGFCQ